MLWPGSGPLVAEARYDGCLGLLGPHVHRANLYASKHYLNEKLMKLTKKNRMYIRKSYLKPTQRDVFVVWRTVYLLMAILRISWWKRGIIIKLAHQIQSLQWSNFFTEKNWRANGGDKVSSKKKPVTVCLPYSATRWCQCRLWCRAGGTFCSTGTCYNLPTLQSHEVVSMPALM